ncbi:MAG: Lpg1974 family pore-forming outer membrane protein, partial [Candidatus Berkiella sp.]
FDYAVGLSFRLPTYRHTRVFVHYDHFQNDIDRQGDTNIRNLGLDPTDGNGDTQGISELDIVSHEFRIGAIHDLHFGDHFCLDLLAFFEWDKLRQELTETISQDPTQRLRARRTENIASGWGPGVGFVSRWYAHNPNWHVFAGVNSSLIKMENDFTQTYAQLVPNTQVEYDYDPNESDSIVGKLDIEFGLTYACAFRHEMQGMKWDISLGMRYMNMFNVFKNGNTAYQPLAFNNGGNALQVVPVYLGAAQDWGKYGPFLRFKIGGNHS